MEEKNKQKKEIEREREKGKGKNLREDKNEEKKRNWKIVGMKKMEKKVQSTMDIRWENSNVLW